MLSTSQPGANAQAKNSSTKTTLFMPLPKTLDLTPAPPLTRITSCPDPEVKTDVTTISSHTKINYSLIKLNYTQGLKALEKAQCTTFPSGYYDDKIGSLYDLNIAIQQFGNCWDESKLAFYRYAEYHLNRAMSAFKTQEREYLNKAFTSIGKSKKGLEKFIYEPMNKYSNQKIEIYLNKQPESIEDCRQLVESIRLRKATDFQWGINPHFKIYLIESLLQDLKDSGHVEFLNSGYIETMLPDDVVFRIWVKIAPKTFDEYYRLALSIYCSNDSNLNSTLVNTESYWIQSHSNISVAVFELTKWAAYHGHKSAQTFLKQLQQEISEMNKENVCNDDVAENNICEDTTIQLKI